MHQIGNKLLQANVLNQQGILGSPVLVNIWNGAWLILLLICFPSIALLFQPEKQRICVRNYSVGLGI